MHFLAGAHAARADNTLGRVIAEIGVAVVARNILRVGFAAGVARLEMGFHRLITHIAQAHGPRHILQFAVTIGAASQAIQRVIGNIQLHHAAPQLFQLGVLRGYLDARRNGRGARCGRAIAAFNFHKAQAA